MKKYQIIYADPAWSYVDKALADENAVYNSTVGKWFITDSKNETKEKILI